MRKTRSNKGTMNLRDHAIYDFFDIPSLYCKSLDGKISMSLTWVSKKPEEAGLALNARSEYLKKPLYKTTFLKTVPMCSHSIGSKVLHKKAKKKE